MPELPEVETVRRTLAPVVGQRITGVWDSGMGLHMGRKPPRKALRALSGATIRAVHRRGKYLLLDTDRTQTLLVHLGMTGRLLWVAAQAPRVKHTHMILQLSDGRSLRFVDARRFGLLDVLEHDSECRALAGLGPDPLVDGVDAKRLQLAASAKRSSLKAFILDQSVLAGLGNIYASEALWRARLHPARPAHDLTVGTARTLAAAIEEVLANALDNGGTSLRDFVNAEGKGGENADYLWVYGRNGAPCLRCKTQIERVVLHGRATFYCPKCQARPLATGPKPNR